jgi:2-aminoadipate transaminase
MGIEDKIAFVPGEACYPEGLRRYNAMRINFSYPTKEQILEGVKRLKTVIQKYMSQKLTT